MRAIKSCTTVAICLVLLFALMLAGCSGDSSQLPDPEPTPWVTTNPQGIRIRGDGWPEGRMGDFPVLDGDILDITDDHNGMHVDLWRMDEEKVRAYVEELIELGYDGVVTELPGGGFMFNGVNDQGDRARVVFTTARYTVITFTQAIP